VQQTPHRRHSIGSVTPVLSCKALILPISKNSGESFAVSIPLNYNYKSDYFFFGSDGLACPGLDETAGFAGLLWPISGMPSFALDVYLVTDVRPFKLNRFLSGMFIHKKRSM
jgi:hypothetical protein